MSTPSFAREFAGILDVVGSVLAVSAAARQRGRPGDAHLKRVGIDPDQFHRIRRYRAGMASSAAGR